ncbi:MAG TPA: DUF1659 domain-containing protein [Bacillota bacterium]|nr:DUF1659 domain-containing protein [Bacillota bacterium]
MAIETKKDSKLRLVFEVGTDEETGDPVFKAKMFNRVKPTATPEQLYRVATTLADLQKHPLLEVERRDELDIQEG